MRLPACIAFPAVLLVAACAPAPRAPASSGPDATAPALDDARLAGSHWRLVEATDRDGRRIDALFPHADLPLQLDFADGRVSVSNACNRIGGSYLLDRGELRVERLVQTQMACADAALMQSDAAIGARLHPGGSLRLDGDRLVLATAAGDTLRFDAVPTAATRYGGLGERVFLEVAAQRVPCPHAMIPDFRCLHVRELRYGDDGVKRSTGDWQFLYQDIERYTHVPGVRNVLRLDRYSVAAPPADGSSVAYVLDMVVESEVVDRSP
jgi:heat shock protein HslJ